MSSLRPFLPLQVNPLLTSEGFPILFVTEEPDPNPNPPTASSNNGEAIKRAPNFEKFNQGELSLLAAFREILHSFNESPGEPAVIPAALMTKLNTAKKLEETLASIQQIKDPYLRCLEQLKIRKTYLAEGNTLIANDLLEEAIRTSEQIEAPQQMCSVLLELSEIYQQQGDLKAARATTKTALDVILKISNESTRTDLFDKTRVRFQMIHKEEVQVKQTEDEIPYIKFLEQLTVLKSHLDQKHFDTAKIVMEQSSKTLSQIKNPQYTSLALIEFSKIFQQQGDFKTAKNLVMTALKTAKEVTNPSIGDIISKQAQELLQQIRQEELKLLSLSKA
jgi:tetratricopeptide (TPR) repeat protein